MSEATGYLFYITLCLLVAVGPLATLLMPLPVDCLFHFPLTLQLPLSRAAQCSSSIISIEAFPLSFFIWVFLIFTIIIAGDASEFKLHANDNKKTSCDINMIILTGTQSVCYNASLLYLIIGIANTVHSS